MNHAIRLAVAGMFSAALVGVGCEQDRSSDMSASRSYEQNTTVVGEGPGGIDQQETRNIAAAPRDVRPSDPTVQADLKPSEQPAVTASTDVTAAEAPTGSDAAVAGTSTGGTAAATETNATDATAPLNTAAADATPEGPAAVDQNPLEDAAQTAADQDADMMKAAAVANVKPAAAAPKDMQVSGTVGFMPGDHGLTVMVNLKGLKPNGTHGFHIHEKGDLSDPKLTTAGPHFNPGGKKHGGLEGEERHGGDLGNLTADADGNVKTKIMAHGLSIDGEKDGIVGRSIIVHAKPDDMKTDPSGDSGDRIAGGKIEKHGKGASAAAPTPDDTDPAAASRGPAAVDTTDARTAAEKEAAEVGATATDPVEKAAEKTDAPVDQAEKAADENLNK